MPKREGAPSAGGVVSDDQVRPYLTKEDAVYERLKGWILNGHLHPGQILTQQTLVDTVGFDVSRMPLRAALGRLQSEGLVEARPHRSARVASLSTEEMRDVYAAREVLEGMLAGHAVGAATVSERDVMREQIEVQKAALRIGDYEASVRADREFHSILYRATGFFHSLHVVEELRDISDRYVRAYAQATNRAEEGLQQHVRLLEVCDAGNVDLAIRLTQEHVREGARALAPGAIEGSSGALGAAGNGAMNDKLDFSPTSAGRTSGQDRHQ